MVKTTREVAIREWTDLSKYGINLGLGEYLSLSYRDANTIVTRVLYLQRLEKAEIDKAKRGSKA